jgi:hypothetical protein
LQLGERLPALLDDVNQTFHTRFHAHSLTPLGDEVKNAGISDAPIKYFISQDTAGTECILFVSRATHPHVVSRTVVKIKSARHLLGNELGAVALPPTFEGRFEGRSYAIWPRHKPVNLRRLAGLLERKLVSRRYLRWQRVALPHTRKTGPLEAFTQPLACLEAEPQLPEELRRAASGAVTRLQQGRLSGTHVLQHSDMWFGNFLMPRGGTPRRVAPWGFFLVDWAGALEDGYPFIDLTRFCLSAGIRGRGFASEVRGLAQALDCAPTDGASYALCSLGQLGLNLDQFPKARYLALCRDVFFAFKSAGLA